MEAADQGLGLVSREMEGSAAAAAAESPILQARAASEALEQEGEEDHRVQLRVVLAQEA